MDRGAVPSEYGATAPPSRPAPDPSSAVDQQPEVVINLRDDRALGHPWIRIGQEGLTGASRFHRAVKRMMDLVGSVALLALFSPIMVLAAASIRLTSRGPILYRQERVGRDANRFHLLKFRSMVNGAHAKRSELSGLNDVKGPVFKIKQDPRVTKVGRVLRRWSIDEMPNLFNVLNGELSLVGPRPPLPEEVETYGPWEQQRLLVRPGITCLWQVSGRTDVSFEQWMEMDIMYIKTWTLRQDLALLIRTPGAVIRGNGAY